MILFTTLKDLVVKVCSMTSGTEGVSPDTARVLIYLDDGPGYNNGFMCPGGRLFFFPTLLVG